MRRYLKTSEWLRFIAREDKDRMPPYYYRRLFRIAKLVEKLESMVGSLENAEVMCKAALEEHSRYTAPQGFRQGDMDAWSAALYRCCEKARRVTTKAKGKRTC